MDLGVLLVASDALQVMHGRRVMVDKGVQSTGRSVRWEEDVRRRLTKSCPTS